MEQSELVRKVAKIHTDMYEGDGPRNPSITARMATQEAINRNTEEKVNSIQAKIDKGFWLLIATLLSAVGSLLLLVFKHS